MHARNAARIAGRLLLLPLMVATLAGPASATSSRRVRRARTRDDVVQGQVVDAQGAGIAGATVRIVELGIEVTADQSGNFSIEAVPAGSWSLEVRRPGYQTELTRLTVPSTGRLAIRLVVDPVPIDPLTVSVTRRPLDPHRSPLPTSSVGREDLDREQSISLAQTLERLAGVRTLSTGREIGKPVIRGLSGARLLVLSEGMRLEDYAWSDEDAPSVDAAIADRVEVVRGPASVIYGPGALGGVVNVIPRSLPRTSGGESIFRGDIEFAAATNNREADVILRGEGATGAWGWRTMLAGRKAEALHTPEGELENTGFEALSGEAAIQRHGDWGSLTARYVRYGGEFRLLEEDGPPQGGMEELEEEGPERKLSDDRLQLTGNFPIGNLRLETRFQGQRHHLIELEDDPEALAMGIFREVPIFDLTLDTGLGEALLHHELGDAVSGTVGLSARVQSSTGTGIVPLIPDASMNGVGIFALERWDHGRLTLLGGARADFESVDANGVDSRSFNSVTWSGGAAVQASNTVSFNANFGRAWRPPTLFELYANGPRLGEGRYEIGSADLAEEHSTNLDVGVRWDSPRLSGEVSAYRNSFGGFLFIQPTNEMQDGYQVFRYDQADALFTGLEGSVQFEASANLSLRATGETVRATNEARDEPLPLIPPARIRFEADIHTADAGADRKYMTLEAEHISEQDRLNPNDLATDAYTLFHASAGIEGRRLGRDMRLDLRVRNLTDESYRDFLSRYKSFALNPGRDIVVRLRMGL